MDRLAERARAEALRDCAALMDYEAAYGREAWQSSGVFTVQTVRCFSLSTDGVVRQGTRFCHLFWATQLMPLLHVVTGSGLLVCQPGLKAGLWLQPVTLYCAGRVPASGAHSSAAD